MPAHAHALTPGQPNTAFNGGSITMDHVGGPDARNYILAFAFIPGQGVLVLFSANEGQRAHYISKFGLDGQLDRDFGDGGKVEVPSTGDLPGLLVAGEQFLLTRFFSSALYATRFNADGKPDSGYGSNGTAVVMLAELNPADALQGLRDTPISEVHADSLVQGGGKIPGVVIAVPATCYVADTGEVYFCFTADMRLPAVVRVTDRGTLDTTFNGAGFRIFDLAGTSYSAANFSSAAVDAARGLIVLMRTFSQPSAPEAVLMVRLNENGSQDFPFGNYLPASVGALAASPKVIVDPDGALKIVGAYDGTIARGFKANGTVDPLFNNGEPLHTPVTGAMSSHGAGGTSGLQGAYRLVAATHIGVGRRQAAITRQLADGTLDAEFGQQGIVTRELDPTGQGLSVVLHVLPDSDILIRTGWHLYWLAGFARDPKVRRSTVPWWWIPFAAVRNWIIRL